MRGYSGTCKTATAALSDPVDENATGSSTASVAHPSSNLLHNVLGGCCSSETRSSGRIGLACCSQLEFPGGDALSPYVPFQSWSVRATLRTEAVALDDMI